MTPRAKGILWGALLPPVVFALALWAVSERYEVSLARTWTYAVANELAEPLLALAVVPNLLIFMRSLQTNIEKARGVLIATMGWAVVVLIVKYAR